MPQLHLRHGCKSYSSTRSKISLPASAKRFQTQSGLIKKALYMHFFAFATVVSKVDRNAKPC
jgi:hypothetical protein